VACLQPTGWVLDDTDCDDADVDAFPGAIWFEDFDLDGFGNAASSQVSCLPPTGWVSDDTDCDDADGDEFPGQTWYDDVDIDTFGDPATATTACEQPAVGAVTNGLDCNDSLATSNPLGIEVCDGIDQDCDLVDDNGFPDLDLDGTADCVDPDADGDLDPATTDCDDLDPLACSTCGFSETCGDGIDNDCDPATSCWDASYVDPTTGNTVSLGALAPVPAAGGFVAWYDYSNTYSASSNTGLEISDEVVMMTYVDPNNGKLGLVMIADIPNDGDGGSLTVELSGMTGGQIAVMDDPSDNAMSSLNATSGLGTLGYNWVACCTDGFVITDLDPLFCAVIDITASTGINGISVYDGGTAVPIPGGPTGSTGALPPVTICESF